MNSTAAAIGSKTKSNWVAGGQTLGTWGGQACNPYDTERVARFGGGSGVSIGGNLAMLGICGGCFVCRAPRGGRAVARSVATTKGVVPDNGNQWMNDRAGIHTRKLADAAFSIKSKTDSGYFDTRDPFTAIAKGLIPDQPYASFRVAVRRSRRIRSPCKAFVSRCFGSTSLGQRARICRG